MHMKEPPDFKNDNVAVLPPYEATPPPAGVRIPCSTHQVFPDLKLCGPAPFTDVGGQPVFVASAIRSGSVQPCKAAPHLPGFIRLAFGGREIDHLGRYDVLPITDQMEWVPAARGVVPAGRQPVEAGYEPNSAHLYHAVAEVRGLQVPGKTGQHLGGARIPFDGKEVHFDEYSILCWR